MKLKLFPVLFLFLPVICHANSYSVNVYFSSASLQSDFIGNATSQYIGTLVPSTWFPNTYNLTITAKNPSFIPPPPPPSDWKTQLDNDTTTLKILLGQLHGEIIQQIDISSDTYLYGWASGTNYQSQADVSVTDGLIAGCSSYANFGGGSSTTWDSENCQSILATAANQIFNLFVSTVPVVPGF